ncbi:MAG: phosphatidylinositol-specific phospholipase C domain-containing protein [Bacteroidaceae bacterium]|nr:phosphatidylinositol-specific phospholipase C domain-containing protein [Bacteroidaceae bacterium]
MHKFKHIFFPALLLIAASSCSSDDDMLESNPATSGQTETQAEGFQGLIADELDIQETENLDRQTSTATRSTLNDGKLSQWATNDKISISDGLLNYTYQPTESSISGSGCSFEPKSGGNAFTTDGTGTDATFYAFYPADAVLSWNGPVLTTMIYTEQKYSENVDNSGVMGPYMMATATTTDGGKNAMFRFGHVCSIIDVDLSSFDGGEVDAVSLYANSQVSIAGRMKYDAMAKTATVINNDATDYSYSTQSEMIRVSEVNATKPVVRFFLLPVSQEKGFTITVRTTDGNYYTKSSSTAVGATEPDGTYLASMTGVTSGNVCKPYYKKYTFGAKASARTQNWMAMVPGNVKFNHLSLPGTHDAATKGCTDWTAYTICQDYTILEQLQKGCRAFDLRPHTSQNNSGDPVIYHGNYSTNTTLGQALDDITSFLDDNPTETAFVLIHEEEASSHSTDWANRVWTIVSNHSSHIARYGWNGNLNPCRGKMVVIFRDNYTDGTNTGDLGCGKVGWGSSFDAKPIMTGNGSGTKSGQTLYYQDEYDTSSASDKLGNLETMLNFISANETNASYTFVNNTNIAKLLNSNTSLAKNVNNAVLGSSVFTDHNGRFGIMMTDFLFSSAYYGDKMFKLIHEQNYKYVYLKRTRCTRTSSSGTDTGADISSDEYADETQVFGKKR